MVGIGKGSGDRASITKHGDRPNHHGPQERQPSPGGESKTIHQKTRYRRSGARHWYAWHGVCFMGCKSPVREWRSCGLMVHPLSYVNQVRDEGNCGEVTNRGEEACECAVKLTLNSRRQSHSRQSCEVTNRNRIQGRCGQVSEPIITKPSLFIRIGKSGACAAKVTRLIQGDPSFVSVRRACSKAERFVVNTFRDRRKSAEVVVLSRHTPLTTGRTER